MPKHYGGSYRRELSFYLNSSFNSKLISATKWSSLTEIVAKLVTPITSMILARVLAPEIFGIVASVNVVISFWELSLLLQER